MRVFFSIAGGTTSTYHKKYINKILEKNSQSSAYESAYKSTESILYTKRVLRNDIYIYKIIVLRLQFLHTHTTLLDLDHSTTLKTTKNHPVLIVSLSRSPFYKKVHQCVSISSTVKIRLKKLLEMKNTLRDSVTHRQRAP